MKTACRILPLQYFSVFHSFTHGNNEKRPLNHARVCTVSTSYVQIEIITVLYKIHLIIFFITLSVFNYVQTQKKIIPQSLQYVQKYRENFSGKKGNLKFLHFTCSSVRIFQPQILFSFLRVFRHFLFRETSTFQHLRESIFSFILRRRRLRRYSLNRQG